MAWQQLITDLFLRISQDLETVLEGLTVEDLNQRPRPDSNSIGWLAWHLTRSHDRNMSEIAGEEQLWIKDGWYLKFGRTPDPSETGYHHSPEEAAAFRSPDSVTVLEYHRAVVERIKGYIDSKLSETELERESHSPTLGTTQPVQARLVGVLNDAFQHVGQAAYARGLLKGRGWSDR
ncbi:MAG: DinB family protein [Dehalococcoidales bacterium]|nr:MAG: DinB family protein [Dehalococcoidales bacterium]